MSHIFYEHASIDDMLATVVQDESQSVRAMAAFGLNAAARAGVPEKAHIWALLEKVSLEDPEPAVRMAAISVRPWRGQENLMR